MQIKDIMTPNVEVTELTTNLKEAATKMKTLNVGSLPVREGEQLVGMITDRDIVIRGVAEGSDPDKTTVSTVMTSDLVYCFEDQDVQEAAQVMADRQIRRLPIVNREHQLVGIVSLGDLAVDGRDDDLSGEALEEISKPAEPMR
jgi:CBS domain-containing protein